MGVTNGQSFSAPANTTTYTVTGTDANGCTNNAQVTVSITSLLNTANLERPDSETYSCNGGQIAIYGQVYEPGITDGPGQGGGITVEYGYSTTNSDPSTWTNWSTATYNTDILDGGLYVEDEYNGIISQALYALTPATYYYTFRYQVCWLRLAIWWLQFWQEEAFWDWYFLHKWSINSYTRKCNFLLLC
jgi:hypothetical protein